jgi:hypothetical protein
VVELTASRPSVSTPSAYVGAQWNPGAVKVIGPRDTERIARDIAEMVFPGVLALRSGSRPGGKLKLAVLLAAQQPPLPPTPATVPSPFV